MQIIVCNVTVFHPFPVIKCRQSDGNYYTLIWCALSISNTNLCTISGHLSICQQHRLTGTKWVLRLFWQKYDVTTRVISWKTHFKTFSVFRLIFMFILYCTEKRLNMWRRMVRHYVLQGFLSLKTCKSIIKDLFFGNY